MLEYGILTLAAGGTLVAARPPGFPGMIARHRATASVITVGKLHQLVARPAHRPARPEQPAGADGLRLPARRVRLAEALDVLGPVVFHGYGQTETGMISMVTPAELLRDPPARLGRPPARGVDLSIRTRPADRPPRASSSSARPRRPARTGPTRPSPPRSSPTAGCAPATWPAWTRDGYLHLSGRIRDVIIVNANLVYAGPIERVLAADPAVAEAYVVGRARRRHRRGGARVRRAGRRAHARTPDGSAPWSRRPGRGRRAADHPGDRPGCRSAERQAGQARPGRGHRCSEPPGPG